MASEELLDLSQGVTADWAMCEDVTIDFVVDCRDIGGVKEYDVHLSDQSRVWLQLEAVTQNEGGASALHAYSSALVHVQKKREAARGRAQRSDKPCAIRTYRDCTMGGALSRYQLPNVGNEELLAELAAVTALTLECDTLYITSKNIPRNMDQIREHGLLVGATLAGKHGTIGQWTWAADSVTARRGKYDTEAVRRGNQIPSYGLKGAPLARLVRGPYSMPEWCSLFRILVHS